MPGCTPCPYESPCYRYEDRGSPVHPSDEDKKALKGAVSRELRAGVLYTGCDCIKRNGLQDDCQRSQCQGSAACLTKGGPTCLPGRLALQRVRDAPNAKIKRDPDHFKVRCDDKPGGASRPESGKREAAECDVIIVMQTRGQQAPEGGSQPAPPPPDAGAVCPACGMKMKPTEKGRLCEHCTETASMGVLKRADGLSDDDRKDDHKGKVFLCFPATAKRDDIPKK